MCILFSLASLTHIIITVLTHTPIMRILFLLGLSTTLTLPAHRIATMCMLFLLGPPSIALAWPTHLIIIMRYVSSLGLSTTFTSPTHAIIVSLATEHRARVADVLTIMRIDFSLGLSTTLALLRTSSSRAPSSRSA